MLNGYWFDLNLSCGLYWVIGDYVGDMSNLSCRVMDDHVCNMSNLSCLVYWVMCIV